MTEHTIQLWVVDDEPGMCRGIERTLHGYRAELADLGEVIQFETRTLGTGQEFFAKLEGGDKPEILLLDNKLPDISGLDILDRLVHKKSDIVSIMITGYGTLENAIRATKLGAFDFLSKPFSPDELRYCLEKAATHRVLTEKAKKLAEERRQIRFQFLSVLSHELKAPINAVEGYLDILKDRLTGEELGMVERSSIRLNGMRKLIFDLLDLTRIESGKKKRAMTRVDLSAIIRGSVDLFRKEAVDRGITLSYESPAEAFMNADPTEIEIIVNNLISNAIKYNRDHGSVTVRINRSGEKVLFTVADTGIGLRHEEAKKLFKEFVRIRNEQTTKILGSGLGLSTVKKLANLYEGDITVESEIGKGSTFAVVLYDRPVQQT